VIRVANAPVSYGAFELTVGVLPNVPGPDIVLDAIAAAGYEGTELGPIGYLGRGNELRPRLRSRGLALAGAFVELRFGEGDFSELEATLDLLDGFDAKPVLADKGPRDGDVDLGAVERAAELARARGFEPTFHHHMGTRVQTPAEVERLLEGTSVGLLLDTGHLTAGGGDPVRALRDWRDRIDHLHVKDVRLNVIRDAASWDEAWRAGAFCELGTGDVDLEGFFAELAGYSGWLVVEQDWVPGPEDEFAEQAEAQARNRVWLTEHAGV
jgi:inosose dehydratase